MALENLKIFREEDVLAKLRLKIARLADLLGEKIEPLTPVVEVRQCGFIAGIELRGDPGGRRVGRDVCHVARRHGLSPQQLFGWRHQARNMMADADAERDARALPKPEEAAFAAVIVGSETRLQQEDATTRPPDRPAAVPADDGASKLATNASPLVGQS